MNSLIKICPQTNTSWGLIKNFRKYSSSKVAIKEKPLAKEIKETEQIAKIFRKEVKKKPQKLPFVKNFFLGKVDTDLLAYPEITPVALKNLETQIAQAEGSMSDGATMKQNCRISGLKVPQINGGRELNESESCRYYEILANDTDRLDYVYNEQLAIPTILKYGSENQKVTYLNKVASGELLLGYCVSEKANPNPQSMNTSATLCPDGNWVLNGEKNWIVNGSTADLFIVFAKTQSLNENGIKEEKTAAFLVPRDQIGITTKKHKHLGLSRTDISDITFSNVQVSKDDLLGTATQGEEILSSLLPGFRLTTGPICTSLTKLVLNNFLNECNRLNMKSSFNLMDTELIRSKFGEIATSIYAMESVSFYTSLLLDQYENQDCELETAIVKVLSSEHCLKVTSSCLDFLGTEAYMSGHWCNALHQNALSHVMLNETNDNLKLIIALIGLQYAGVHLTEEVKKMRNPMFHPMDTFKRMWTHRKQQEDKPSLVLQLKEYLHPSLMTMADHLEYCILRLQYATETILARYGVDVTNKHIELMRLGNAAVDIYAMTACLSRASRSYCIGLQHAEYELYLAFSFCLNAKERIRDNINKICAGPYSTNDANLLKIAEQIITSKTYFPKHPLSRNY